MFNAYVGRHPKTGKMFIVSDKDLKQKQAQIVLAEILKDIEENGLDNKSSVLTFKQLYDKWLAQQRLTIKPSSVAVNKRFAEKHILPYLGDCKLDEITVIQCQDLVNKWFNQGHKLYSFYRKLTAQIMRYGESMELMNSNPMRKTILPKWKEGETKLEYYTKDELNHFLIV